MTDWASIETAPEWTCIRIKHPILGVLPRVYNRVRGEWLYGRGWRVNDFDSMKGAEWRLATEYERHIDQDYDESRLAEYDAKEEQN